jgi:hypothetical protein
MCSNSLALLFNNLNPYFGVTSLQNKARHDLSASFPHRSLHAHHLSAVLRVLKPFLILHTIMHGAQVVDGTGGFSTGQPIEHPE